MCVLLKEESRDAAKARKKFAAKMRDPLFVEAMLSDAGVNQPPCHFCRMNGTCNLSFGDSDCKYELRAEPTADLEGEFFAYVEEEHRKKPQKRKLAVSGQPAQFSK